MPVLGQLSVTVRYGDYHGMHILYVVEGGGPCLLGRDWLQNIQLDWASIKAVYVSKGQPKVEALINKFPNVFKSGLGTMKCFQAHLYMKDEVKPKWQMVP